MMMPLLLLLLLLLCLLVVASIEKRNKCAFVSLVRFLNKRGRANKAKVLPLIVQQ